MAEHARLERVVEGVVREEGARAAGAVLAARRDALGDGARLDDGAALEAHAAQRPFGRQLPLVHGVGAAAVVALTAAAHAPLIHLEAHAA